jgi:thioredoxin-related protein
MKTLKITLAILSLGLLTVANAQNGVLKQQVQTRPQPKTISEADYKAHAKGWMVDINKAYEESKRTGKPIMANFTGSDWCGWCKKLKYEVFDKPAFKTWADKTVVLVELDFPRRFQIPQKYQEQNRGLQQAFKVSGYPTIWVFNLVKDEKGQFQIDAMGKTGYVKGVSAFTGGVNNMILQAKQKKK